MSILNLDERAKPTYRIADLLPSTAMGPGSMPAVAVFANMDDSALTILDQVEYLFPSKAKTVHHTWPVTVYNHVGLGNKLSQSLSTGLILEMQVAVPFAPIQVVVDRREVRHLIRRDSHDTGTELGQAAGDCRACDDSR